MDEANLRARQTKTTSASPKKTTDSEEEKMLLKNRKPQAENYDFGDVQKVPPNIRDILDKQFLRLFVWEFYFGRMDDGLFTMTVDLTSRLYLLVDLFRYRSHGHVLSDGETSHWWIWSADTFTGQSHYSGFIVDQQYRWG